MRTIPVAIMIAAAMLALPAGSAEWRAFGSHEPDNREDKGAYMWTAAPGSATNRIYFNGFTGQSLGIVSLAQNVNVAALQTRMQPSGLETYVAILGNWVDCNQDGYVGFGELGLREYDASLLVGPNICPASSGDINAWDGSHNYNGWVSELIPVGTDGGQPSAGPAFSPEPEDNEYDLRILRDVEARVWGDFGRPDDTQGAGGATCPIRPFPRGTLQSTGGILDYTDCHSARGGTPGLLESWNTLVDAAGDPLGLRFSDPDNGTTSPVGRIGTLGSEDSSNAAVFATDCSQPEFFNSTITLRQLNDQLGNPIGDGDRELIEENVEVAFHPIAPGTRDLSDPTIPGQINQTLEEFGGNCDTSDDAGHDTYGLLEGDFEGTVAGNKRQALFNMEFEDNGLLNNTPRGRVSDGFDLGVDVDFPVHGGRGGGTLNNAGPTHDWFARVALVKAQALPGTRSNVNPNDPDPTPPADYMTYYAFVGPATTGAGYVTPGGSGKYGSAQCGSFTSGIHNGWNCDASLWYLNGDGTPQPETQGGMARVGAVYQLRDVDCEDGGNGIGVPLGPAALSEQACSAFGS